MVFELENPPIERRPFNNAIERYLDQGMPDQIPDDLLAAAQALGETTSDVIEALCMVWDCYAAIDDDVAEEKARVADLKKRSAARKKAVRLVLEALLANEEIRTIKTANGFTITRMEGKDKLVVTDIREVPDDFAIYVKSGDTRKALTHMKQTGELPPGFAWDRNPDYITIRFPKKRGEETS
ncbi:MAG: siphovirus Gp157 family protein [Methanophagales archaeon]|nr:siphovirus Gp157 family protein [Methanophagales archaeon]